jgi:EAL domain-containing protein (putative c-di-GMP-specific phosphodiesterase class I)
LPVYLRFRKHNQSRASHQLNLGVVAEGIETQQQLAWLQQLGCEFGQGYLFSKPLAPDEIERIFLQGRG